MLENFTQLTADNQHLIETFGRMGETTMATTKKIETVLKSRGKTHGGYKENFRVIQNLKATMKDSDNWEGLLLEQKEALEMLAVKVGRILTGDSCHKDSWVDIEGYTHLISQDLAEPVAR